MTAADRPPDALRDHNGTRHSPADKKRRARKEDMKELKKGGVGLVSPGGGRRGLTAGVGESGGIQCRGRVGRAFKGM